MKENQLIQPFGEKKVRTVWDAEQEKWFFSIVDVCGVLTDQPDNEHARNYWKVLKHRLIKEGNQTVTNCNQLKLRAEDGRMRLTDVADMEQMFPARADLQSDYCFSASQMLILDAAGLQIRLNGFRLSATG